MAGRIKIEGQIFGDVQVIEYLGNKKYKTKCIKCGEEKVMFGSNIRNLAGVTCNNETIKVDLTGSQIGEWQVIKYAGNKRYLCRCSCGKEKEVLKANLINGSSTSCGHNKNHYGNLVGQQFGEWKVIGKEGYYYKCQCSCKKISLIGSHDLVSGKTRSCGHNYNAFTDISGQKFGLWNVLEYVGDKYYRCQCSCENNTIRLIRKADLLSKATTSCGCNKSIKAKETLLRRYGDIAPNRVNNPRTIEQIQAINSKEDLKNFIENHQENNKKLTSIQLSNMLGIQLHRTLVLVHKYELDKYIVLNSAVSSIEDEIYQYIKFLCSEYIEQSNREILKGKELDIYIPSKKLAIEVNGTFWHSDIYKEVKYHQQKTLDCARQGIRLIHIFEYEWKDEYKRQKIMKYLDDILVTKTRLQGRLTAIKEIYNEDALNFCEKYHLQGGINSSINIGLFNSNELIGVMTFGKPRFQSNYQYEILRMCYKAGITVLGGTQKLFKYFIDKYNPSSVITYSDISKFTGNIYLQLGFELIHPNPITIPNYVWVEPINNKVLKRYETTKNKLKELGYEKLGDTEDEIMKNLGYLKIYDSGNIRLIWRKER